MVESQTTTEWYNTINNSVNIAHYKYSYSMQHNGSNGIRNIRVLVLFNYRLIIVVLFFPQQISVYNRFWNKVVGVMFANLECKGRRSVDF